MTFGPLPYSRRVFDEAQQALTCSATAPLSREDWEHARQKPASDKFQHDFYSLGGTWSLRHARRRFATGQPVKGALCGLMAPLSFGLMLSTLGVLSAFMYGISHFERKRSPEGVKEDRTLRAIMQATACVQDAVGKAGRYRLACGEVTVQDLKQMSEEACLVRSKADSMCRREPNGAHAEDYASRLQQFSAQIDALDRFIAEQTT